MKLTILGGGLSAISLACFLQIGKILPKSIFWKRKTGQGACAGLLKPTALNMTSARILFSPKTKKY